MMEIFSLIMSLPSILLLAIPLMVLSSSRQVVDKPPISLVSNNGMTFEAVGFYTNSRGKYLQHHRARCQWFAKRQQTITLDGLQAPSINNINGLDPSCGVADCTIQITVSGGTPNYQYSIDGGMTYQGSNIFNGLDAGVYNVVVLDANGLPNP